MAEKLSILNEPPKLLEGPQLLHHLVPWDEHGDSCALDFTKGEIHQRYTYRELQLCYKSLVLRIYESLARFNERSEEPLRQHIVPLLMPQSPGLYISQLAILNSGGAFCPLNLDSPTERLKFNVKDVEAKFVITTSQFKNSFSWEGGPEVIMVEEFPPIQNEDIILPEPSHEPNGNDLAYVMYTSGSSGTPKGVAVSHLAASQSLLAHELFLPRFERFLQFAAPSFDVSVFEIFFPLKRGKTLIGCDKAQLMNDLPGVITTLSIDAAELTPGVAGSLLEKRSNAPGLKLLLTIGEMLTMPVVEEFGGSETQENILYGMYGPTEAAIHCTVYPKMEASAKPGNIGVPFETVSTLIAAPSTSAEDAADLKVLPVGELGELILGGPQLAQGYLNREEQNKLAFIQFEGRNYYRTGDKARQLENGTIEILGRISAGQVKLRGQRLELGEVEDAVYKHNGVKTATAAVVEKSLVVYTLAKDDSVKSSEVIETCSRWLPKYMIPSDIVILEKFPYLPSGKIDKRKLDSIYLELKQSEDAETHGSMTETERAVKSALEECVGRFRNHVRLAAAGVDSLISIRVASKLRSIGFNVSTIHVLQADDLVSLARLCDESASSCSSAGPKTKDFNANAVLSVLNGSGKNVEMTLPCTPLQLSMLSETAINERAYRNWVELELPSVTDLDHVISCLESLANLNPILRTGFVESITEGYVQVLWKDLSGYQIGEVQQFNYEFDKVFDASLHHPVRIQILPLEFSTKLLIYMHHALYDAWSLELMLDDLNALLASQPVNERPPFAEVVDGYQDGTLGIDDWPSKDYWKDHLEHLDYRKIPCFHSRKAPARYLAMARWQTSISTSSIEATARDLSASPQSIFQAVFSMILGSYLGTTDVCFGTVFSGRTLPITGIEDIVGPCLTTLPIRVDTSMSANFKELVREINKTNRKHLEHSVVPLRNIKSVSGVPPGQQLFDTLLIWQQTLHAYDHKREFVSLVDTIDNLEFNLTLEIIPGIGNIELKANYQQSLFPEKQIDTLLQQLEQMAKSVIEDAVTPLDECFKNLTLGVLSIENENPRTSLKPGTLSSSVEKIAVKDPDRPAVNFARSIDGDRIDVQRVTYSELNARGNQIGALLLEQNVLPDEIVCICMEKSVNLYASILAITKVGAGYLPQTPEVPLDRLGGILEESTIKTVLAESSSRPLLKSFSSLNVVYIDEVDFSLLPSQNIPSRSSPEHVSYCVYTSGSTGTPKGVLVTQGNLLANLDVLEDMYPVSKDARLLQQCSQAFSVSVFEIFFIWRIGGCLCSGAKDVLFRNIENAIRVLEITHLSMTPSVAALVDPKNTPKVQFLVTAGEAVTQKVFNSWAGNGLWQGYGPSEMTNICTVNPRVTRDDPINNIGPPFSNTSAFVLSSEEDFAIVPLGGEGEFVFGGPQVFRGYVDKTKEVGKIIEHPQYGRLYRSGDFGRMLPDGSLSFTGRKDDQVKIRGQRVGLGEITNIMLRSENLRDCVTMLIGGGEEDAQKLVSFWTTGTNYSDSLEVVSPNQTVLAKLYKDLESALPPYMVPSALVQISSLPSTTQGKIDKRRLVQLYHSLDFNYLSLTSQSSGTLSDRTWTELEKDIVQAVANVTKTQRNKIGAESSFFNFGIDSISASSLARIIRQSTNRQVEISDILKYPSAVRLAEQLAARDSKSESSSNSSLSFNFEFEIQFRQATMESFKKAGKVVQRIYPCTPLQEAMLSAGESSSCFQLYDNQVIFDVFGDAEKLQDCWREMVQRHEILRTCFVRTEMPSHPYVQVVLERHDLQFRSIGEREGDSQAFEPPYSLDLVEINGAQKLTVSMNHALYDGVALDILYKEVEMVYNSRSLPPPVSFAPFLHSMALMDSKISDKFWDSTLKDLKIAKFPPRKGQIDRKIATHILRLTANYPLSWVEGHVKKYSTSLLAVFQTAWASLLSEKYQVEDVCFGNVVSGRTAPVEEIERLVAPCFNTIPARLQNTTKLSYLEAFRKLQNLNADSIPFHMTPLRRLQAKFSADGSRLFDTLFILQQPARSLDSSIWSISDDSGAMDFPLVCEVVPNHADDTLGIILHSYTSILSYERALDTLNAVQEKVKSGLENPRRQLLSTTTKEEIAAKSVSRRNVKPTGLVANASSEAMSPEELELRDIISNFTDVSLEKIGRDMSIFRLGLDSISVVQVAARLRRDGHKAMANNILEHPTIAQLSSFLTGQREADPVIFAFDFESFDTEYRKVLSSKNDIKMDNIEAVRPCTFVQQGMIATTLNCCSSEYINSMWLELPTNISISQLKSAWQAACTRHEILRTGFASTEDPKHPVVMVTRSKDTFQLPWHESWRDSDVGVSSEDLLREPWSLYLGKEAGKSVLRFAAHHALYDAQSAQMILSDIARLYASEGIPVRPSVNLLLGAIIGSSQTEQDKKQAFWQSPENKIIVNRFPDLTPLHVYESTSAVREISSQISTLELERMCRAVEVTVQAASQAAWARLLTAYTGEASTTFGMTLSGRSVHEEADRISFPSIVTLPVRCDVLGTNEELLSRTMNSNASLHKHQFTPLTSIQRWAGYPEGRIFDTLFTYQKLPKGEAEIATPWVVSREEASVDYAVSMEVQPSSSGKVVLRLTFRQDLIPAEQAELLLRQYDALLLDTIKNPERTCDIAPEVEKELIAVTPALEDALPSPVALLHEFVVLGAEQRPNKIALEFATNLTPENFKSEKWTYRQLNEESNRVANLLLQRGVVPREIIAICFDKCPEASFAIIGIMKAGCAYVALDPTAPDERSKFIVKDSAAKMILSAGIPAKKLQTYMEKEIISLDAPRILGNFSYEPPRLGREITPEDVSYCLYTSGTTGTPKGCLITHNNAVQFMLAFSRIFAGHWTEDSKYLQFASFHFDVSVMEQFWSWSIGICVASAPRDLIFEDIPEAIRTLGITNIDLTPSLARLVHPDDVPTLCKGAFITGGEQLKQEILDVWGEHACIYNGYGPTEATIGCTMYPRVPKNGKPTNIGPAYVNVGTFVLKPGTELPVLRGGIGELCVSGKLVGKGYLNREDLTAERFPTLKSFNERVYRTGDLVRILHNDTFIFLGRADDQVKLRGQRLELSEINQVIKKSMSDIQEVVTLVLKHSAQQNEQLVTFFVLSSDVGGKDGSVISTMREACRAKLPGYMVPTHFIPVKAIPLNANNKADSKQLAMKYNEISVGYLQKLSQSSQDDREWDENEKSIVAAIAKALSIKNESLSRSSNIFELGLDSISIIGFSRALQGSGLGNAKISIVKSNPSIGALVRALLDYDNSEQGQENAFVAASQSMAAFSQRQVVGVCKELGIESMAVEHVALCTPMQEGIIYRFLESDQAIYFNKFEFLLHDDVDVEKLLAAWDSVVEHLEILRTRFVATDDGFAQVVLRNVEPVSTQTIVSYEATEKSMALRTPYTIAVTGHTFTLRIFHGLYDGNSLTMLLRRVIDEYHGLRSIEYGPSFTSSLSRGPLAKLEGAENFWKSHLQEWTYQPMPYTSNLTGNTITASSIIEKLDGFETLRKKLGVTPQAVIQAVWISVLQNILSSSLTIGIVISGRTIDFEGADKVIGPLFNTVPFHAKIESSTTLATLIAQCHDYNMKMQDFQHTPLKDIQKWGPSKPGQALFDTLFVFQRLEAEDQDFADGVWTQSDGEQIADYPLAFEATLSPDSSKLSLTIVAQGSAINQSQASGLLVQVQRSLLEMLETAGQSIVSNNGFSKGQRDNPTPNAESTSSVLSGEPFTWTKESNYIKEEIARLANLDEGSIHEHSSIFELGLDSIDVIKLASRLKKRWVEIPVSIIIKSQTIAKIAANISSKGTGSNTPTGKSLFDMCCNLERHLESTGRLPDNVEAVLPATPLQQSMVNEMINSNFERYFNVDGFKLNKDVDLGRLMEAVKHVVDNSPILRTNFVAIDDPKLSVSYAQIIYNSLPYLNDAAVFSKLDESHSFESFMEHFKHIAISLAKQSDQLLQIRAVSASDSSYLVIAISHALYDGTSLRIIHEDIQQAYNGDLQNRPDFMPFLEEIFQSTTDDAKTFWRTTLSDLPSAKFPRKELSSNEDSTSSTRLEKRSRVSLQAIEESCKSSRITLQTLGQTCWALVLSELMGQLDVVFGAVLSCRDSEEAAEVMFPLMNTVAVRSVIHGSLREMLQYMQDINDTTRQYQHFPLGTAQAYALASRQKNNPSGDTTLFDTLFIYQGRRSTAGAAPLYDSVYGISDVEFPVCVEMEIVNDEYLSWTTKCKSIARNAFETEGILDFLETVLERIISASQEQTIVSEADGVSVCGLPKFQIKDSKPRTVLIHMTNSMEDKWSQIELNIRKVLHQISDVPEENIRKDTTIFRLGLDSILVLKLPALLKAHGIKLSVSNILRDQTVYAMAKSAQGPAAEAEAVFDVDAEISRAISSLDLGDELAKLERDIGEVQYAMPATAGQLYMIRQWQASRGSMFYQTFTYSLPSPINKPNLEAAWSQLLERHDILRTGFFEVGSNIVQVVFKEPKNEVIYHRGKGNAVTRKQNADLKEPALNLVVEVADGSSVTLKLVLHHVLYDGVSLPILIDELQALYHGRQIEPLALSFKDFVAHSVVASSSAKEKWIAYLSGETLYSTKAVGNTSMKRIEVFHHSMPITDVKQVAQEIGVSVDTLFLAAISKIQGHNFQAGDATKSIPQVVFGIYLANRAPYGEDLSLLAAPTLNLLPVRVKQPLERGIAEISKDIQADIQMISAPDMVSVSLAEIYEWTGVRVNSFVNILKSSNPGTAFDVTPRTTSEWNAIQDRSNRAEVVDGVVNERVLVPEDGRCEAYLPTVDIEMRFGGEKIDMGVFAPAEMMSIEDAVAMIERFIGFWDRK